MSKYTALYNPQASSGTGEKAAHKLDELGLEGGIEYVDMTAIGDYGEFFGKINSESPVIICGGDGTLNRFVNDTDNVEIVNEILYFPCGTGNDFLKDIGEEQKLPIDMNRYIKRLPSVRVNGKTYKFLNNVGFGIDGYCTEEGDRLRAQGVGKINYAGIAIKGMLGKFRPLNASVTIDGEERFYKKAWLAPTMNGRYYGGGMMACPNQDRLNKDGTLSVMLFAGKGRLKTLIMFPSIFKGEHIKYKKSVHIMTGHNIKVKFDRPCPLQIDGETILGVTEYEVFSNVKENV